jgi:hypothetical protein
MEFDRENPTSELLKRKPLKEYLGELNAERENHLNSSKVNPRHAMISGSALNTRISHKPPSSPPSLLDTDPSSWNDDHSIVSDREDEFYEQVRASKQMKRANREEYHE